MLLSNITVIGVEESSYFTDTVLLRFFRGLKNKEDPALQELLRHFNWRKENDVDNIMTVQQMRVTYFASELRGRVYSRSRRAQENFI